MPLMTPIAATDETSTTLPRPWRLRAPARRVSAAVLLLATGAVAVLAAGSAAAAEPGRCTDDVNVRARPEPTAEIVALCEAGTRVRVGEQRDGFVELAELGGWSAARYVAEDGPTGPTTEADQVGDTDAGADPVDDTGPLGGPRFQRWMPTR